MTGAATSRTRRIVVGVIAPLVIALVGLAAILIALPALPDPIAVHWGPSGEPDGYGTPMMPIVLIAVIALAYGAFAFAVARSASAPMRGTANQRMILAMGPFLATVLTVLIAGSTVAQAGLVDARDAPSSLPLVAIGFGGGIALAVVAWLLLPADAPAPELVAHNLPTMDLAATQRATWMQRIGPSRRVDGILALVGALVVVGGGVAFWIVAPMAVFATYLAGMAVSVVLVVGSLYWRVTIDGKGFVARSALGLPRFAIPLTEVGAASTIEVVPIRDFGGWGIRWGGPKRLGVITRGGAALEVRRRDGRALVVTVARAEQGAALLNSLARRG